MMSNTCSRKVFNHLALACSTVTPIPAEPTPNMDAIVQVKASTTLSASEAATPSSTQPVCQLTGGETVQIGWTGKDTRSSFCNSCFCTNSVLGCTKMACPEHTASVNAKPDSTPGITPVNKPTESTNNPYKYS